MAPVILRCLSEILEKSASEFDLEGLVALNRLGAERNMEFLSQSAPQGAIRNKGHRPIVSLASRSINEGYLHTSARGPKRPAA